MKHHKPVVVLIKDNREEVLSVVGPFSTRQATNWLKRNKGNLDELESVTEVMKLILPESSELDMKEVLEENRRELDLPTDEEGAYDPDYREPVTELSPKTLQEDLDRTFQALLTKWGRELREVYTRSVRGKRLSSRVK